MEESINFLPLDEAMTKGGRDMKETLLMMDRVDAKLADRRKKLKESDSITEGSQLVPIKA